jgi:hypothetical protein
MKRIPLLALLATSLASVVLIACSAPEALVAPRPVSPGWQDTGTPPASVVSREPERRYYTDHTGAIWDDRGKQVVPAS